MIRKLSFLFFLFVTLSAQAGPYDGIYSSSGASCNTEMLGHDGGPIRIQDTEYTGVEMSCQLTKPTSIRAMNATLYDAKCTGEGEEWDWRIMLMKSYDGIYWIQDEWVEEWVPCP
jgi:hypothetical protein